jgi:CO/xanthine dehydrogenase Mo-binding subunit
MEAKDYLELDFYDDNMGISLNRRDFLKTMGSGIFILFTVGVPLDTPAQSRRRNQLPDDINAFLKIGEDGLVTCFTGKIEMGQGIISSLPMMLAEELNVSLDMVDIIMGDTDLCPWDRGTFGSLTTRMFGPPMRAAAAEARAILVEFAAEKLNIPKHKLKVKDGIIFADSEKDKKVSFAELTKGKKITRRLKTKALVEKSKDYTIVAKPLMRRDALEKVTGKAKYAGDLREPGMLYARILRPPSHEAKLISVDTSAVKKIKGAHVIKDKELIAVLHEDPDLAALGLTLIKAKFETPKTDLNHHTIFDHLLKMAPEADVVAEGGNLEMGKKNAKFTSENTYLDGYVAHAPIEPHTALAKFEKGKATIWASTQTPFRLKSQAAEVLGVVEKFVRVITPFVGGGFGGKTSNGQAIEAVRLAKASGKPVQVAWTRWEEFFYDRFRPAAVVKIKGGVDSTGKISLWDYGVYLAGQRGAAHFYDIPHHRTLSYGSGWHAAPGTHPFGTGAWRGPANNTNTFARESHIDVMAAKAGIDPLEFRLNNLKDKRMIRVLKACAEQFGWKPAKPSPSGRGWGIAMGIDAGTYVAEMAEVEVNKKTGEVKVKRVVCAQDMGLCVNPEGAKIQMEGCITMGLGYALTEDIHFKGGEILDTNFDTYEIPKFSWLPKIETVIIDDKDSPSQGGGEPAIICMGGLIANAIFDACGARMLQLPMTPERIRAALA